MDFRKLELIFLIVFVAIDIFLYMMLHESTFMQSEDMTANNSDAVVIREMKHDDISLNNISSKVKPGYYVSAKSDNFLQKNVKYLKNQETSSQGNILHATYKNPIALKGHKAVKVINKNLTNSQFVSFGQQYDYMPELSTSKKIVYSQKIFGSNFYEPDAKLQFNVKDNHIVSYTQGLLSNIKILKGKESIISSKKALGNLYQYNEIPNNSTILWTKLFYTKMLVLNGINVYIPTWVIYFKANNSHIEHVKRINALTGDLLKTENIKGTSLNTINTSRPN